MTELLTLSLKECPATLHWKIISNSCGTVSASLQILYQSVSQSPAALTCATLQLKLKSLQKYISYAYCKRSSLQIWFYVEKCVNCVSGTCHFHLKSQASSAWANLRSVRIVWSWLPFAAELSLLLHPPNALASSSPGSPQSFCSRCIYKWTNTWSSPVKRNKNEENKCQ